MCEAIVIAGLILKGCGQMPGLRSACGGFPIIDLHTGDQPVYSEDRSVIVMMNGELYNYREVRAELERRGHKFATNPTPRFCRIFMRSTASNAVEHVNGMFAFALWDMRKKADDRPRPVWRKAALLRCI